MLFMIDVEIDVGLMGDRRDAILKAEHARTQELIDEGVAVSEWRKASGRGVLAVWDCDSNLHLNALLRDLPIAPYLKSIDITPLVPHPLWPDGRAHKEPQS